MQNNFVFIYLFIFAALRLVWGFLPNETFEVLRVILTTADLIKALEIIEISGAWQALL